MVAADETDETKAPELGEDPENAPDGLWVQVFEVDGRRFGSQHGCCICGDSFTVPQVEGWLRQGAEVIGAICPECLEASTEERQALMRENAKQWREFAERLETIAEELPRVRVHWLRNTIDEVRPSRQRGYKLRRARQNPGIQ